LVTSTSVLTLMSSTAYTQPFGSNSFFDTESFSNDMGNLTSIVIGWQNLSSISVVFEGIKEATCQCCGLHTIEVNPHHTVGLNGAPHWESRWEVECGIRDDGSVSMTILLLFSTPSTVSEIIVSG
jgi:hypothetical protein